MQHPQRIFQAKNIETIHVRAVYSDMLSCYHQKGENYYMERTTTTKQVSAAIANNLLKVTNVECYYKSSGQKSMLNADTFIENLQFLDESGVFAECMDWKYEKNPKSEGEYIIESGRMNPGSDIVVSAHLFVTEGASNADVEKMLMMDEEMEDSGDEK